MGTKMTILIILTDISLLGILLLSNVWADIYDTANFGSTLTITETGGQVYDTANFGSTLTITTSGGSSDYSDWWEFYKLDNRYDVNTNGEVNAIDANTAWFHADDSPVAYLYDVNDNDDVNAIDANTIWYHNGETT